MSLNIGWPERLLRLAAGTLILGLYGALPGPWRYITLVGLLPIGTALRDIAPCGPRSADGLHDEALRSS